jgi:hypothetical protein
MTEAVSELFALAQDCNDVCLYDAVKLYVVALASGQLGDFNRSRAPLLTTYMHFSTYRCGDFAEALCRAHSLDPESVSFARDDDRLLAAELPAFWVWQ